MLRLGDDFRDGWLVLAAGEEKARAWKAIEGMRGYRLVDDGPGGFLVFVDADGAHRRTAA